MTTNPQNNEPIEIWVETHVYDLVKSHSDKYPYYHANIEKVGEDKEKNLVHVRITIEAEGRNEYQQNLTLLLINSLK
jgi:hypothetical protein